MIDRHLAVASQALSQLVVPILGTWYCGDVRIIARSTLTRFVERLAGHKDRSAVKAALDAWFHEVKRAEWKNSSDVKASYTGASIVGSERVVFNIKGNAYRLVTAVDYRRAIVFIKWLGTHKEYDEIDVRTVRYATEADQDRS
jgi:mRNA interferase HigB